MRTTRVLEVLPDLADLIDPDELPAATQRSAATVAVLPRGRWRPPTASDGTLGFLVLEGLLIRTTLICDWHSTELLGPGDPISGCDLAEDRAGLGSETRWKVVGPVALAVLDRRWHERLARWPQVQSALRDRCVQRTNSMAVRLALAQVRRLSMRVWLVLWHLAVRWGRADEHGVLLPLDLSHQTLAELVCAQRPSVTRALGELTREGIVVARDGGGWVLRGTPPAELRDLAPAWPARTAPALAQAS